MVNVILSSDDITVLGGPSRLNVDLNIGATGTRGSLIFNGFGNPNLLVENRDFPTLPKVFDIFIDVDPGSDNYLQAYQYVNQDGANSWTPAFKITQNIFSVNKVLDFSNGTAETLINLTELGVENIPFDSFENSSTYFNVSATISNVDVENLNSNSSTSPIAYSVLVKDAYYDSAGLTNPSEFPLILPLEFSAAELVASSWSPLDEKRVIAYLTVSFANPDEIFLNLGGES